MISIISALLASNFLALSEPSSGSPLVMRTYRQSDSHEPTQPSLPATTALTDVGVVKGGVKEFGLLSYTYWVIW